MSVDLDEVPARAQQLATDPDQLVVGRETDVVPAAPSHRWVLFPAHGGCRRRRYRGQFAPCAEIADAERAAEGLALPAT